MKPTLKSPKWLPWGLCFGLLSALLPVLGAGAPQQGDSENARCEQFVIEWDAPTPQQLAQASPDSKPPSGPVGLVEIRRRRVNGAWQLEQDVEFQQEGVRVMAVERLGPNSPGMIWRELSNGHGRTLVAEWRSAGAQLEVREWNRAGSVRKTLESFDGMWMPMSLHELVRGGRAKPGPYTVFDPLQKRLDRWTLELSLVPGAGPGETWRQARFVRSDGSLAGIYQYDGDELMALRWQESGLRVRRISAERYEELSASLVPSED